jgi:hypothetical protein
MYSAKDTKAACETLKPSEWIWCPGSVQSSELGKFVHIVHGAEMSVMADWRLVVDPQSGVTTDEVLAARMVVYCWNTAGTILQPHCGQRFYRYGFLVDPADTDMIALRHSWYQLPDGEYLTSAEACHRLRDGLFASMSDDIKPGTEWLVSVSRRGWYFTFEGAE